MIPSSPRHLVVRARRDAVVFPIGIVDLQLHEIDVGMGFQHLFEQRRSRMEREPEIAHLALALQVADVIPQPHVLVVLVSAVRQVVQQVVVDIAHAEAAAARVELPARQLGCGRNHRVEFRGDGEGIAWMAVHERFARGGFRARIDARCVKVREPCVKEQVDHLRDLVDVDLDPAARKPHQAEPKIAFVCRHTHSLLQRIALVACRSRGRLLNSPAL